MLVVKPTAKTVVTIPAAADAKIPAWVPITIVEVAEVIHLRVVAEIVPIIVLAHVAEVVKTAVRDSVQVALEAV